MTWWMDVLAGLTLLLAGAAAYRWSDLFPRGRAWWEGLPDAPPPDAAAVADMRRAVEAGEIARAKHRIGGAL